ncbi:hypothetical protein [Clostridium sp. Cult3]|uniref:hypothetical protein n=1 Tax=Clostridium sp. Cult3 TaxID=2079004 RepID=UPI001F349DFA|nr:hypothetical protein [Clostridium sp. Cult3]MCF6459674.1 hypothetical protein [Clostridium sp. Cult3]
MAKNKITLNVLADITKKLNGKGHIDSDNKALVVFTGSNIDLDKKIEELKELESHGMSLSLAFSFMGERILDVENIVNSLNPFEIYGEEDIFRLEEIASSYSKVIGPNITMNTLSKVSLGMVDSFVSNILWTYLYRSKGVYLDFASVNNYLGRPTENKGISKQIENHINNLKDMGVVEIEEGNYLDRIVGIKTEQDIPSVKEIGNKNYTSKQVITERDLVELSPKGKALILPKGSIVTPLARDKARELGIDIEIEG